MNRIIEYGFFEVIFKQNPHKGIHYSVENWLESYGGDGIDPEDVVDGSSVEKMIAHNTIFQIQIYPKTPIGFVVYFSHDYDLLIEHVVARMDAIKQP